MNENFPSNQNPPHFFFPSFSPYHPMFIPLNPSQSIPNYFQFSLQVHNTRNILHYQQTWKLHCIRALQKLSYLNQYNPQQYRKELSGVFKLPIKEVSSTQWINETTPKIEENSTEMESENYKNISFQKRKVASNEFFVKSENFDSVKDKIEQMLSFFLRNFNENSLGGFKQQRKKYEDDENFKDLVEVFDALVKKYTSASKCREDMIRFIMRKAVTTIRDLYREEHQVLAKDALVVLCEKYFPEKYKELKEELGNSEEAQEKIVQLIFPYKRESVNRTANSRYVQEIFSSDEFYQDFLNFYEKFDDIIECERKIKSEKFIQFICDCVKENKLYKIQKFSRPPWLDSWNKTTKTIGEDLKTARGKNLTIRKAKISQNKKIKK